MLETCYTLQLLAYNIEVSAIFVLLIGFLINLARIDEGFWRMVHTYYLVMSAVRTEYQEDMQFHALYRFYHRKPSSSLYTHQSIPHPIFDNAHVMYADEIDRYSNCAIVMEIYLNEPHFALHDTK